MANMQVAIGFRGEAGMHMVKAAVFEVLVDDIGNKV